eukprot:CAMPEP_0118653666 /NCGR_PEP_ID=MMETSP0785-20121206/11948_1 /TAXON_ID=91992 /ORGANISM="Bolidomonas pacifica, Strain CCMP 1866" /LENGTH=377 /DNA_ID=CAMNT_0006546215 /DNA_START=155 /DNA_END=1285 /DNA_ORIENTATION=-
MGLDIPVKLAHILVPAVPEVVIHPLLAVSSIVFASFVAFYGLRNGLSFFQRNDEYVKYKVTELVIYPIKSCGGIKVDSIDITETGISCDRDYLIAKRLGGGEGLELVTMREKTCMCKLETYMEEDGELGIGWGGIRRFNVGKKHQYTAVNTGDEEGVGTESIEVFRAFLKVVDCGDAASKVIKEFFKTHSKRDEGDVDYRLMRVIEGRNNNSDITGDPKWGDLYPKGEISGAVDGSQVLVTFKESLDDLNYRLKEKGVVGMECFRPNVVLDGGGAWDEDRVRDLKFHDAWLWGRKLCHRCVMCTVDYSTGRFRKRFEPLRTMKEEMDRYGKDDRYGDSALFGLNCGGEGRIRRNETCVGTRGGDNRRRRKANQGWRQ